MTDFHVRVAEPVDLRAIARMWGHLMRHHKDLDPRFVLDREAMGEFERRISDCFRSNNCVVLIAEELGTHQPIGFVVGEVQPRPYYRGSGQYGFVTDLYVSEEWRRRRVGSRLYCDLKKWFLERRAVSIELYVSHQNNAAIAFWQAMGLDPFLQLLHEDL